jgi:hypothetical protein
MPVFLRTERLTLRRFTATDTEHLVMRYLTGGSRRRAP